MVAQSGETGLSETGNNPAPRKRRLICRAGVVVGSICALGLALNVFAPTLVDDPIPEPSTISRSVEVLDRDGRLLRVYAAADELWRMAVGQGDVDPKFVRMLLAYEDRRFYRHGSVDLHALLRAAWQGL